MELYERKDVEVWDEIDILGFYFEGNFPLKQEKENELIQMISFKEQIDDYYTSKSIGFPQAIKPKKKSTNAS